MDITNPIHPSPVSAVFDGSGGFGALDGAIDAEVFTQGGRTYAIVAAGGDDDGVQIMDITNPYIRPPSRPSLTALGGSAPWTVPTTRRCSPRGAARTR